MIGLVIDDMEILLGNFVDLVEELHYLFHLEALDGRELGVEVSLPGYVGGGISRPIEGILQLIGDDVDAEVLTNSPRVHLGIFF